MRNIIVGTAGHVDHGKTALVRALTGTDTDRLTEEKRRGISIVLGFAHLDLPGDVRLGFIDVPGHERFVKNMLAGAGGIDMVLLVIAADESVMPQTREHFEICRLLGVHRGVIVLAKSDLVDAETLELVSEEVREFVSGSFLADAPILAASAKTGEGIAAVRDALIRAASDAPAKDASRHFRLPVDRAFSMKGFGSVVTGTLVAGAVETEQEVEALPAGLRARVRGVQVHGSEVTRAVAGQRTALNLSGPAAGKVTRGMTLVAPGRFRPTRVADCRLTLLASARPLRHRSLVHFHSGTAETVAEVRLLESSEPLRPGATAFARFLLREAVLLLPRDRFIVRMFSPLTTIGGGDALDIAPPAKKRRAEAVKRLRTLADGRLEDQLLLLASEAPYGVAVEELVSRTGLLAAEIDEAGRSEKFVFLAEPQGWLMAREPFDASLEAVRRLLGGFHRGEPLKPGMPKEELRSGAVPGSPPFLLDAMIRGAADLIQEGETVRLASHRVSLRSDEQAALDKIENAFRRAGLAVPTTAQVLASCGVEPSRARSLLQILLRQRRLVRVGSDLICHAAAIDGLKTQLASRKGQRFSVPQFKDWTGVSRKYAIPLLEFLDRERVTLRQGDQRVVL